MDVYGLTGGIGSGKSSVADLLESYGIPVVSADELSRIVVAHGSEGLRDVVTAFGPQILDDGRELDRRKLASIVFEDPSRRKELEAILHPRIRERFEQVLDALEKAGHDVAVYEVPLLFEKNLQTEMKAVILVTADDEVRIQRVQTRDDVTEAEVRARMAAQMDEEQKRRRADYIIENNGNFDDLRREVEFMLERFMRMPSQRARPSAAARPQTVLNAPERTGVTSIFAPVPARPGPREPAGDPSPSLGIRVDTVLGPKHPPQPAPAAPSAAPSNAAPPTLAARPHPRRAPTEAATQPHHPPPPSRSRTPAPPAPDPAGAAIPTVIADDDVSAPLAQPSGLASGSTPPPSPRLGKSSGAPLRREPTTAKTAPHRSAEVVPRRPTAVPERPAAPPPPPSLASPPPAPPLQPPPRPSALSGTTALPDAEQDRPPAQNEPMRAAPGPGRRLSSGRDLKPGDEPPSET